MWGRASMAAVLIVWASVFARCQGTEIESRPTETEVESMVSRATTWLWYQRDQDAGWFNNTHWVLLALRLANLSRADNNPSSVSAELQLSNKQLELEIVVLLWRYRNNMSMHREIGFSETNLARYTLALSALCKDPRQFHGHDLIGTLQHHEPPVDYDFALTTLAACSAQAHIRKRQIRRLLDITNAVQYHNIDTIAMVVLALRCIIQDHRHRNLGHFVHKPAMSLTKRQRVDGSFGDLRTTALAMQALKQVENEPLDNWNRSSALSWLINRQQSDGSFDQDVYLTAQIILGIIPKSLINIRSLNCRLSNNTLPGLTPNNNFNDNLISSSTTKNVETNTSAYESTASKLPTQTTSPHHQLVNVSYTLWVGTNETYHLTVTAPKNETFYGVMLLAAEISPHFQFSASEWPNGHYVHTLAGYKEEPMSYHYWLLYRLTSPPDLSSPPGNQLVAPGGVDDLEISEGEYYLFWYKKL